MTTKPITYDPTLSYIIQNVLNVDVQDDVQDEGSQPTCSNSFDTEVTEDHELDLEGYPPELATVERDRFRDEEEGWSESDLFDESWKSDNFDESLLLNK